MQNTGWVNGRLMCDSGAYIERQRFPLGGFTYHSYVKTVHHDVPVYMGNDFEAAKAAIANRLKQDKTG